MSMFGGGSSFGGLSKAISGGTKSLAKGTNSAFGGVKSYGNNIGHATGEIGKATSDPRQLYRNPSSVGAALGDVVQSATAPVSTPISQTGVGKAVIRNQPLVNQGLAIAATGGMSDIPSAWDASNQGLIRDPKRAKEKQATAEQEAQTAFSGQQNDLINQMRQQYASPQLAAMRQQQQQAQQLSAQQQANMAFGGGLTQNRIAASRSGQLGGSTDQAGQNDLLAQYYQTVAQGAGNAANSGINFDQQMQQQKAQQEAAVRGAGSPGDLSGLRTDLAGLLNAASRGQITQNALGTALPQLANMGSNYATVRAMRQ